MVRMASILPPWFGTHGLLSPVMRMVMAMAAVVGQWMHGLLLFVRLQTRIRTATGGFLDLIAWDFFGPRVRRRTGQTDDSFRRRIQVEMFRPRATRPAMASIVNDLTGYQPRIFEPSRPYDAGGIGIPSNIGIGVAGALGSTSYPGNVFIDVLRAPNAGIPYASGIGIPAGGIGVPSRLVIASLDQIRGQLRDEDIYSAINATRPVGIQAWVRMVLAPAPPPQD